jgi:hypothetical protein
VYCTLWPSAVPVLYIRGCRRATKSRDRAAAPWGGCPRAPSPSADRVTVSFPPPPLPRPARLFLCSRSFSPSCLFIYLLAASAARNSPRPSSALHFALRARLLSRHNAIAPRPFVPPSSCECPRRSRLPTDRPTPEWPPLLTSSHPSCILPAPHHLYRTALPPPFTPGPADPPALGHLLPSATA